MAAYFDGNQTIYGLGEIRGKVVEPRGKNGFGFDSVFVPDGYNRTMAEMSSSEKNSISHRGRAFRQLFAQLK